MDFFCFVFHVCVLIVEEEKVTFVVVHFCAKLQQRPHLEQPQQHQNK